MANNTGIELGSDQEETGNLLYPIFLKLEDLRLLIVGGGNVGLEKLSFMMKSSPNANVEVVATRFLPELEALAFEFCSRAGICFGSWFASAA